MYEFVYQYSNFKVWELLNPNVFFGEREFISDSSLDEASIPMMFKGTQL